jgi:hypothetical protein
MKIMQLLIVGLALCVAGASQAATLSAVPTPPGEGSADAVDEYMIDDGTGENSIGLTAGGTIYFLNRFNVLAGFGTVTHVRVAWGQTIPAPAMVLVWDDPNNDGNPTDVTGAHVLTSAAVVQDGGNTDTYFTYDVTDAGVGATGDAFYVGVCASNPPAQFPARIDQTAPNNARSWVGGDGSQSAQCTNPNGGNVVFPLGLIDSFGFPGDWMVRANATGTTPVEARTWGGIKATYND